MWKDQVVIVALSVAMGASLSVRAEEPLDPKAADLGNVHVARLGSSNSSDVLLSRIAKIFKNASAIELDRLILHDDPTIAMTAGWERVRRNVAVANQDRTPINAEAISRFFGLVEGLNKVPIPSAWETVLRSGETNSQGQIVFRYPLQQLKATSRQILKPQRDRDQITVEKDGCVITVALQKDERVYEVAFLRDEQTVYLAMYYDAPAFYRILAVDVGTSEIKWSSQVWANPLMINYIGRGIHVVELSLAGQQLAVFGCAGPEAYLEVFEKSSGGCVARFNTRYHHAIGSAFWQEFRDDPCPP